MGPEQVKQIAVTVTEGWSWPAIAALVVSAAGVLVAIWRRRGSHPRS